MSEVVVEEAWTAEPLELTEHERRATHFALATLIDKEKKAPEPHGWNEKQNKASLLAGKERFLFSMAQPFGRHYHMTFAADSNDIVSAIESLRESRKRIDKASKNGLTGWGLTYSADFVDDALDRSMQAAPVDAHEHLGLEVANGVVRETGSV